MNDTTEKLNKIDDYKTKINAKLDKLIEKVKDDQKNNIGPEADTHNDFLEIIRTFKFNMDLLNSSDARINENIILDKLIKSLSVIYNGIKLIVYVVGFVVGVQSLIYLFYMTLAQPIFLFYTILILVLAGGTISLNLSSSRDNIIEYFKKYDIPSKNIPVIQGNLNVLYSKDANSKGYNINGYDYQFLNNINPFSSSNEVDAYLTNMVDQIKGIKKNILQNYPNYIVPINKNTKLKLNNVKSIKGGNTYRKLPYKRKCKSRKKRRFSKRKK